MSLEEDHWDIYHGHLLILLSKLCHLCTFFVVRYSTATKYAVGLRVHCSVHVPCKWFILGELDH